MQASARCCKCTCIHGLFSPDCSMMCCLFSATSPLHTSLQWHSGTHTNTQTVREEVLEKLEQYFLLQTKTVFPQTPPRTHHHPHTPPRTHTNPHAHTQSLIHQMQLDWSKFTVPYMLMFFSHFLLHMFSLAWFLNLTCKLQLPDLVDLLSPTDVAPCVFVVHWTRLVNVSFQVFHSTWLYLCALVHIYSDLLVLKAHYCELSFTSIFFSVLLTFRATHSCISRVNTKSFLTWLLFEEPCDQVSVTMAMIVYSLAQHTLIILYPKTLIL